MKNKTLKKICIASCILGAGFISYGNSPKKYENIENATYQGWRKDEGRTILIFDPKPINERKTGPMLAISGNLDNLDLEIGESYNIGIKVPRLFDKSIISATPTKK